MQQLTFNLDNLQIDRTTHWNELVGRFTERINPDRISAGYKPYSYARVGMMLSGRTYTQLEELYVQCEKASCGFSRYFGWRIKQK
jgi:hypothetical protein